MGKLFAMTFALLLSQPISLRAAECLKETLTLALSRVAGEGIQEERTMYKAGKRLAHNEFAEIGEFFSQNSLLCTAIGPLRRGAISSPVSQKA
jgi:hypothetical protein